VSTDRATITPAAPGVTRWRQKVQEVEAIQWTGDNLEAIQALTGPERAYLFRNGRLCVVTLGERLLEVGCWVIRTGDGEIWVTAEKSFAHNYEPAAAPVAGSPVPASPAPPAEALERAEARLAKIAAHVRARRKGPGRSGISLSAATLILGIAEGTDEEAGRG
jgi:hypothetical protein